jgi:hypothetical protein
MATSRYRVKKLLGWPCRCMNRFVAWHQVARRNDRQGAYYEPPAALPPLTNWPEAGANARQRIDDAFTSMSARLHCGRHSLGSSHRPQVTEGS